jgi:hypothetical protein
MIRQFPTALGGSSVGMIQLDPSDFELDSNHLGADFSSAFTGTVSSIDFGPDVLGTIWGHFNFKNSNFVESKDLIFDLHWVPNGAIGSPLAARITVEIFTIDLAGVPVSRINTTVDITIQVADTGKKQSSLAFITLPNGSISATCDTISIKIVREATHGNDTYTGAFQLLNVFARQ